MRRVSPRVRLSAPTASVCSAAEKAHVAPTCGQRRKIQVQYASPTQRIPATAGKILPFGRRSQHRIWLVAGPPASCQMPEIGQQPVPTSYERRIYEKGQTIQHSHLGAGFGHDTPKSGTGSHDAERLCDRVLSRKTHRDS